MLASIFMPMVHEGLYKVHMSGVANSVHWCVGWFKCYYNVFLDGMTGGP